MYRIQTARSSRLVSLAVSGVLAATALVGVGGAAHAATPASAAHGVFSQEASHLASTPTVVAKKKASGHLTRSTGKRVYRHGRAVAPAAPAAPAAAAPAAPHVAASFRVVNTGNQSAVDACAGGLTHWFQDVDGKPYYPIHRGCGGAPILGLHLGDLVTVGGTRYVVTDARDVHKGDTYDAAAGLNGQILVQTCYTTGGAMRVVALTAA